MLWNSTGIYFCLIMQVNVYVGNVTVIVSSISNSDEI